MEATYHLDESEFDYKFFKSIKATFKGKRLTLNLKAESLNKMTETEFEKKIQERQNSSISYLFEGDSFDDIASKLLKEEPTDIEKYKKVKE